MQIPEQEYHFAAQHFSRYLGSFVPRKSLRLPPVGSRWGVLPLIDNHIVTSLMVRYGSCTVLIVLIQSDATYNVQNGVFHR